MFYNYIDIKHISKETLCQCVILLEAIVNIFEIFFQFKVTKYSFWKHIPSKNITSWQIILFPFFHKNIFRNDVSVTRNNDILYFSLDEIREKSSSKFHIVNVMVWGQLIALFIVFFLQLKLLLCTCNYKGFP